VLSGERASVLTLRQIALGLSSASASVLRICDSQLSNFIRRNDIHGIELEKSINSGVGLGEHCQMAGSLFRATAYAADVSETLLASIKNRYSHFFLVSTIESSASIMRSRALYMIGMRFAMAPVFYFRCGAPAVAILLKSSISS
jgi:hypothetical protein